jgi:hypothetical protein
MNLVSKIHSFSHFEDSIMFAKSNEAGNSYEKEKSNSFKIIFD